ncbi:MAG: DUF3189 family protein [Solirubrobacterales bacterium]
MNRNSCAEPTGRRIIYHCYGGSHSSVTAAAIHLGMLSPWEIPRVEDFLAVPFFDKTSSSDFGTIKFMGRDRNGNDVFVLSKKNFGQRTKTVLGGLAALMNRTDQVVLVDTFPLIGPDVMLGGFVSRRLQLPQIGRPILFWGMRRCYHRLAGAVLRTKAKLKEAGGDQTRWM